MSDVAMGWCGNCGASVPRHELAPMAHSPGLPACRRCRARVEVAGHHQTPFDPQKGHAQQLQARLAAPPLELAGRDLVEVV